MNSTKAVLIIFLGSFLFISGTQALPAQTPVQGSFAKGEELFMQNKPQEALKYLEAAVSEDPAHVQAFLYLGISYLQVNRVDDAIAVYKKILPNAGDETARVAFNLGNAYFVKGIFALAKECYTQAITADSSYASAYLNRANALVKNGELVDALKDYDAYLAMEPGTPQREQVVKLMAFIRDQFAAEDRRRAMAEEAAKADADRRKKLLDEVTGSLQAAAEDSKGLSAGSEDVQDYDNEFELQ